jgi:hypothetical protein
MGLRRVAGSALILIVSMTIAGMFWLNLCNLVFDCGCRSWWQGAAEHCNIHQAGVRHCPWCRLDGAAQALVIGGILAPQALAAFWPRGHLLQRLAAAILAIPVGGALTGWITGVLTGYWS